MVLQRMGSTRPSLSRLAKSWITGTLAAGAVGLTSGAAFTYLHPLQVSQQNLGLAGDHPAAALPAVTVTQTVIVSPSSAPPSGDQCLQLDPPTLAMIHVAESKAGSAAVDVTLPGSVVIACPPATDPGATSTAEPTSPAGAPAPTGASTSPPSGQPAPPPPSTRSSAPAPSTTTKPSTKAPAPAVTSTAS
jgi:hypothetical protein